MDGMDRKRYSAPSVAKAFEILKVLGDASEGMGVSALARKLGMGKSTVHGITAAMEELGVVIRDDRTKRFRVGFTLLELVRKALPHLELAEVGRGPMEALVERTEETAFLGVLNRDHVTIVGAVDSPKEFKVTAPRGTRLSLRAGAVGKVFLANMEREKALEFLNRKGLKGYTPRSITDMDEYLKELDRVSERGFAFDDGEYLMGVTAVAAPIVVDGYPLSALWSVAFSSSLTDERRERIIEEVRRAAGTIEKALRKSRP
ncbi:MAG: IclR family transcriptional regulator [Deltaproteobacteria bacterium]|nr:IclR family transcriptional regulator [Deltaproteobacteria bacterium]MBW2121257.1 IclR family transcriptional regulator [Deltaproteobacteria bacterium]